MIKCPELEQLYQMPAFEIYYNLIVEWNEKFNLTTVTKKDEVYLKHFLDSLIPLEYFTNNGKVLDIGSGAGLPSIPLKLFLPDAEFVLTDSVNKKIAFLNHVIQTLELKKITALHTRIEDLKQKDFDVITARAVAPLNTLCEYALPFIKIDGTFIAYKGPDTQLNEALNAIKILGGTIEKIHNFTVNGMERNIIIIKKIKPTPPIYPRKQNKPRLNPLI